MAATADNGSGNGLDRGFRLGEVRVIPKAGELSGPGGTEQLDPKVMGVLLMLADHAGEVVTREHLLARLWPNAVVTDDALSRCIYELRRQLGQVGGDPRYKAMLETLPKRGYRLVGDVAAVEPPLAPSPRWHWGRWMVAAMGIGGAALLIYLAQGHAGSTRPHTDAAGATDAATSIAVLPFVDLSSEQNQGYFADGIAEEILNRLAQSDAMRVVARTSSFALRDRSLDVREIATRLGVNYVLEGSVRRSGDHIRVTAQLVAAARDAHLWSQTYDRKFDELFAVQDTIAVQVATALQLTLHEPATGPHAPANADAHERYLRAGFFYNRRAPGDLALAARYYEEAVAIDPGYAAAWAALSGAYSLQVFEDPAHDATWLARQGQAARQAVQADPQLAVAHARLACFYMYTANRKAAEEQYLKARELDPNEPLVAANDDDPSQGDYTSAIARGRLAVSRDPLSVTARKNLGLVLMAAGHLDEADAEFHRVLELNPEAGWDTEIELGRILVLQGRYEDAYAASERLSDPGARDHIRALLYRLPQRRALAEAALQRLRSHPISTENVRLAEVYAFRGMTDAALELLRAQTTAIERDSHSALPVAPRTLYLQLEMQSSPFLAPLHADARWAALLADPYPG